MATRPVFFIDEKKEVASENIDFQWFPGMSFSQKQKSIKSLHDNFLAKYPIENILEISSKSTEKLGVMLSAFNLTLENTAINRAISVETAFQASKVFEKGGPYIDLLDKLSRDAKQDSRLKESGQLLYFYYDNCKWPLEPKTLFYDWLYINALSKHEKLAKEIMRYNAFTDIEFNPQKSYNCQARSAALYVSLKRLNLLGKAFVSIDEYKSIIVHKHEQYDQISFVDYVNRS